MCSLESKRLRVAVTGNSWCDAELLAARSKSCSRLSPSSRVPAAHCRTDRHLRAVSTPASPVFRSPNRLCLPHHCRSPDEPLPTVGRPQHVSTKRRLIVFQCPRLSTYHLCSKQQHQAGACARVLAYTQVQFSSAPHPCLSTLVAHLPRLYRLLGHILNHASPKPRGRPYEGIVLDSSRPETTDRTMQLALARS